MHECANKTCCLRVQAFIYVISIETNVINNSELSPKASHLFDTNGSCGVILLSKTQFPLFIKFCFQIDPIFCEH